MRPPSPIDAAGPMMRNPDAPSVLFESALSGAYAGTHPLSGRYWDRPESGNHGRLEGYADVRAGWRYVPELGRWGKPFDGSTNKYLQLPSVAHPGSGPVSYSFWFRTFAPVPSGSWYHLWDNLHRAGHNGINFWILRTTGNNGNIAIRYTYDEVTRFTVTTDETDFDDGKLYNVIMTWDGSTSSNAVRLVVNGALIKQGTSTHVNSPRSVDIRLGAGNFDAGTALNGIIVDAIIVSFVLNPTLRSWLSNSNNRLYIPVPSKAFYFPQLTRSEPPTPPVYGADVTRHSRSTA